MVILIGAESCTGKTLMAQNLLEKYHISYISVDLIKMGLFRANINCGFIPSDSNEHIESILFPILKGIIETTIENNQNLIIEGAYIFPNRLKEFEEEYRKKIIPVFMGFSHKYIKNHFDSGIIQYRSAIEQKDVADDWTTEWFIDGNKKMKARCLESQIKYFEIDENYDNEIKKVYEWIDISVKNINNNGKYKEI